MLFSHSKNTWGIIDSMNLPFSIVSKVSFSSANFALLVFFLIALVTCVMSVIFFFHWRKYGMGGKVLALAEFGYLGVAVWLLVTAYFNIPAQ